MKKQGHRGQHAVNCPLCITKAEQARMPWQPSYLTVFVTMVGEELQRKHDSAVKRKGWKE